MQTRQLLIAVALGLTLVSVWYVNQTEPADAVVEVVARSSVPASNADVHVAQVDTIYQIRERDFSVEIANDLFSPKAKPVAKPEVLIPQQAMPEVIEPPKPVAPPLPFTYLGKIVDEGKWTVFVAKADKSYSLKGGETIDGMYSVVKIDPPRLIFKYIPLATEQMMLIGDKN